MRIVAIDASPRRGVVTLSVEAAARAAEDAGAHVDRVRLCELDIRFCTGCSMCRATGRCKIADDLPALADLVAASDGVILGTPSYFRRPNEATQALIDRLSSYFTEGSARGDGRVPATGSRRAVIITACSAPEPLATFFGYSTGPVRELRRALGRTGTRTVGSLAVTDLWLHPEMCELEQDRASSLGRLLAGKL
ncbi:MAG: flavodoxin family protein [Coriobacteriia bacterium]|nr:flavodoxin family protein [Coriobacteriia bacterium]